MTLGQRIQELRKALGLSQEALGEKLNVSRQAISKWEADGAVPEVDKLIALSRLFGVSLNELLQVDCPASTPEDEDGAEALAALAQKARRRRRLSMLANALGGIAFVIGIAALMTVVARQSAQLGKTRDELTVQERRISQLETQVAALREQADRPGLDPSAPLVASFDCALDAPMYTGPAGSGPLLAVSLLPAQSVEGMTVTFQVSGAGGDSSAQTAELAPGSATEYRAVLQVPVGGGVTVSAVFDDGAAQYTQPLLSDLSVGGTGLSYIPLWMG